MSFRAWLLSLVEVKCREESRRVLCRNSSGIPPFEGHLNSCFGKNDKMNRSIDINCDLGEGVGNEAQLMPYLSSCNIACGGHAGDEAIMEMVVDLAAMHHVKIGAHPSFPDRENFGRQIMNMSSEALRATLIEQVAILVVVLEKKNLQLHHIKPHGALYNVAAIDKDVAIVIVEVAKSLGQHVKLYVPYQSVISKIALQEGVRIKYEAFADRNYNQDLTLVSRRKENALIRNSEDVFNHVYKMISEGKVITTDGVEEVIKADTFCVHGDGENVVENLKYLNQKLRDNNVEIL